MIENITPSPMRKLKMSPPCQYLLNMINNITNLSHEKIENAGTMPWYRAQHLRENSKTSAHGNTNFRA